MAKKKCKHPNAKLLKRKYGWKEMGCPDCGHWFEVYVQEPLDIRPFGQLRTFLGDPPPEKDWAS